jgi:hypothetical protein
MSTVDLATIRLTRVSARWRDAGRDYRVILDAREISRIPDGSSLDLEVTPGQHTLRLRIDWTGSRSVTFFISAGQIKEFTCGPARGIAIVLLLESIIRRDRYVVLSEI